MSVDKVQEKTSLFRDGVESGNDALILQAGINLLEIGLTALVRIAEAQERIADNMDRAEKHELGIDAGRQAFREAAIAALMPPHNKEG